MSKNDDGKEKQGKTDKKSDWELTEHCSKRALRECKLTIVASGRQIPFCLHGWIAEHAPSASCSVRICLLFHISLARVLVHPSAADGRRWNTLALPGRAVCDVKPDGCQEEHLRVFPHYEIAAAVFAVRGDGRVPSSSQEQMDKESQVLVGCD